LHGIVDRWLSSICALLTIDAIHLFIPETVLVIVTKSVFGREKFLIGQLSCRKWLSYEVVQSHFFLYLRRAWGTHLLFVLRVSCHEKYLRIWVSSYKFERPALTWCTRDMHVSTWIYSGFSPVQSLSITTKYIFCLSMQIRKRQPVGISDFAYAYVSIMILMRL
jgi:hypothetical protein